VDSQALRQFAPCAHVNRKPTAAEQEELDALARRGAELEQQAQALDDAPEWSPDEAEMIDLEEQDIAARRKAIHEALKTWTPEQKAHAGRHRHHRPRRRCRGDARAGARRGSQGRRRCHARSTGGASRRR
jgi:hypothetical protein